MFKKGNKRNNDLEIRNDTQQFQEMYADDDHEMTNYVFIYTIIIIHTYIHV